MRSKRLKQLCVPIRHDLGLTYKVMMVVANQEQLAEFELHRFDVYPNMDQQSHVT